VDPSILVAVAILAAPAVLVLATLSMIGAFIAGLADHAVTGGMVRRPG
jgi:hypothetical protein